MSQADSRAGEKVLHRADEVGHVASSDWRASVHGTHAERNEDPDDARVEETRAEEAACAPSARIRGNRRTRGVS